MAMTTPPPPPLPTNATNLKTILNEKCVILTGGRDKQGNILVQFPSESQLDRILSDDLQKVILYLASINNLKQKFVFVIDMRGGRKYECIKPILKILQTLQENFQYQIHHVFIIKPDTFWQKQKISFGSSKYNFDHSIISIEQLSKYFDSNQLTSDLEGTMPYNHEQWIDFRIKLENFLIQSADLIHKLNQLQNELNQFEQPETKELCQDAIQQHLNLKQKIYSITIEPVINEGRNLLRNLIGDIDMQQQQTVATSTRDSGYSGSASSNSSDVNAESGCKYNNDYFNEANRIKEPMEHIRLAKQKLQSLWQQKKIKLEQCLQLRIFEQECNQMLDWLNYNNSCILTNYTDIGQSYSAAVDLLSKHELFHKNCFNGASTMQQINSIAQKLLTNSHYASAQIQLKLNQLDKEWQLFHSALKNRQKILSASCMFHQKADQYLSKVDEWKQQCSCNQLPNTVQEAENYLKKHHELSDDISQIYSEVCNDGKAILDSIQSSQMTAIGQMEFKQAASHILDIVYEILSNHRQLEHLWVNKKQKLQNRYRMLNFQLNIKQVYNWLENHGEVFLRKNQSVGKNLMRAKMLHLSHENFVKVLKNTITNVEKLLQSADDLVISGEFEPQDIYSMTKELEQRMTVFLQRVEKRKNILDLSVLFHTHVVELDNWFNELKLHWTTFNFDQIDSDLGLIQKHLEGLNEQKQVTSEAVDKTKNEGESLLNYLKEISSTDALVQQQQQQQQQQASNHHNSYVHIESIVNSIVSRHGEVNLLISSIKTRLEVNLQIKLFEKDSHEISMHLEHWYEELKYVNENFKSATSDQASNQVELWLQNQIKTANHMQACVFELLQRGAELTQNLEKLENDPSTIKTAIVMSKKRIQTFMEYLNEREKELHEVAVEQQRKLGHKLQINQLENECQQLLVYIAQTESEQLFHKLKFAYNLNEAEEIRKDYELFKLNVIERIATNVGQLQTKADRILVFENQTPIEQQGPQLNKNLIKFEQLMQTLNSKWQLLLIYIDNRNRLIMAQINFYKYTEQVTTVLESLEREYTREEDWYEKSKFEFDPEQYLQQQLQIHNQKKQSFLKACNWARRTGETFQKYAIRTICDAKKPTTFINEIELNTKRIMDDIHLREERTIKSWNKRKNALDECYQYVIFEKSSKEALAWLHDNECNYLSKFQNVSNDKEEMKKVYKEFCELTDRLKNQQGYVNLLIELSPKLLESSIRYGNMIAAWANKVETRYKEFFNVMSNIQQLHGLLAASDSNKQPSAQIEDTKKQEILKQNEQKQKLIKKRQNIISEIIQTEKAYVQDLFTCIDKYLKELKVNPQQVPETLRGGKEAIIFGNMEEIYNFHKNTFLVELENYENMPEDIGHCFVIYADQFQIYVEYCKNKENSTKLLLESVSHENYFKKIQHQWSLKSSLDSYLIKPIQRITKYQLLLKDLLGCCEDNNRTEIKDALDVMLNVPKKANDAIHLSHLEGLEEGLSKDALGDVLLQDRFQVWDSKQIIKKGKERQVFLFETSIFFAKEIKDTREKLKYVYKFKLMTSEINVTEHMEGDSCKFAVWTGRAPLYDHRVILKASTLETKQMWVKRIRELIQEKYYYMEVAMLEAGMKSNRDSKEFDLVENNNNNNNNNVNSELIETCSSAASNSSSGNKASNDVSVVTQDYVTPDNGIKLTKGQHVNVLQRINNETCLVQLIAATSDQQPTIEVPSFIIRTSSKLFKQQQQLQQQSSNNNQDDFFSEMQSQSSGNQFGDDISSQTTNMTATTTTSSSSSSKRKGSFKKWLRASHRKLTTTTTTTTTAAATASSSSANNNIKNNKSLKETNSSSKMKKVLSNSDDIKLKTWNIGLTQQEDVIVEENSTFQQQQQQVASALATTTPTSSKLNTPNKTVNGGGGNTASPLIDDDIEDLTSLIPPPMNVIKAENSSESVESTKQKETGAVVDSTSGLSVPQQQQEQTLIAMSSSTIELSSPIATNENTNNISSSSNDSSSSSGNANASTVAATSAIPPTGESKLIYAIRELLNTERDYVNDLAILIDKYMEALKRNEIQMPQDFEGGKDKIVFGNIFQIYEWHKSTFCPELEKCLADCSYIGQLFVKYEKRFQMYVKYCENKPKSEYIVSEYDTYFEELRIKLNQKLNIQDLLIKPVQRIMKYQLMLKEIKKYMEKQGMDCKMLDKAIEIMVTVPKNADDMMNVGRLQGFEGRITAQGCLLLQDTLFVQEPETQKNSKQIKLKERRVFLFQQIIIFSEMIGSNKKFTSPKYIFKNDIKVNKLKLQKEDSQLQFTLIDKTPESNRKIICQCDDVNKYNMWIQQINDLLDMQNRFLRDLQHPQLAMQKNTSASELVKSTLGFASAAIGTTSKATAAVSPSTPTKVIVDQQQLLNNDFNRQLTLTDLNNTASSLQQQQQQQQQISPSAASIASTSTSTASSFCSNIPNTAKCSSAYTAITEDEISLQKGDIVQIITANLHNRFLVHREATNLQPAAEGWIPGFVIGFKNNNNNNSNNKRDSSGPLFNFGSIYDEFTDNRKSTTLTEFQNELQDVYCKLGQTVLITFQLANNLNDLAKSIKILNPKKLVINQQPNVSISFDESRGLIQLRLENVSKQDIGEYECLVANRCGTSSSRARLYIRSNYSSTNSLYEQTKLISDAQVQFTTNPSDYKDICELSRGRFSVIKRAIYLPQQYECVLKLISKHYVNKEKAYSEYVIASALNHVNFLKTFQFIDYDDAFSAIVMQFANEGKFFDYLCSLGSLHERSLADYIKQLLVALDYLHMNRIIHLDVKPENILIDTETNLIKLIDFGDAIKLNSINCIYNPIGNVEFYAPEIIASLPVNYTTDVWSVGVITYVLISGISPFLDESDEETSNNIFKVDFIFPPQYFNADKCDQLKHFIRYLLVKDPNLRPNAKNCLKHVWLNNSGTYASSELVVPMSNLNDFVERRRTQVKTF